MLQHMVREAKGIPGYVGNFTHKDIIIFLIIRSLIKGNEAMPHGTGIHGPGPGQPKVNKLIHPVFQQLQIDPINAALSSDLPMERYNINIIVLMRDISV